MFLALAVLVVCFFARNACAQACCAAGSAITPARLSLHEQALVGLDLRAALTFGSYTAARDYSASPAGASELEFRQQLLGALRLSDRSQLAAVVPITETYREAGSQSEFDGGLGDINLSGRYDFFLSGQSHSIPGIALLAGVSLPTGTSVESATRALATDATGIGSYQFHLGLALEQSYGRFLLGLSGTVAYRTPRTIAGIDSALSPEWSILAAVARSFDDRGTAVALFALQTLEGRAEIAGKAIADSERSRLSVGVSSTLPITEDLRLNTGLYLNPPLDELGQNYPASAGSLLILVRTWS